MTTHQLTELVEAHQTELFRYLKFLGASHATAEDILQDLFVRAFDAAVYPDLDNPKIRLSWLRRIGHNLFIDHCRRNTRSAVAFDSEIAEQAEGFWRSEFLPYDQGFSHVEALEKCLRRLPERQRNMIDSFYARGNSREHLASEFGISSDSVKMALRRIRHSLGNCIQRRLVQA